MQRGLLVFLLLISLCFGVQAQGGRFILKGKIRDQATGSLVFTYPKQEKVWVKDTVMIKKGSFRFAGTISEPVIGYLRGAVRSQSDDDANAVSFYIEPASMTISLEYDHFKQMKLTGSKTQQEYEGLQQQISQLNETRNDFYEQLTLTISTFINTHPSSYVSAFELLLMIRQFPVDTAEKLYHNLSPSVQQSYYGKQIYPVLTQLMGSLPGRKATAFNVMGIGGQPVDLSSFKGKYVLLDFWASWCVPCRQGAPYLRAQFAKYHPAGLEIIGIADDDEQEDEWKKAIAKDSVFIWYNVLRGMKKDKNGNLDKSASLNDMYGIGVLPTKILLDKNGVILGRYEGTENEPALYKKLSELFSQ